MLPMVAAAPRLQLLGGCRLVAPDGRDVTPRSAKAKAVLAFLAMSPSGLAERGRLSGLLWSRSQDAKASLRQAVKEIRVSFASCASGAFLADHVNVRLDAEAIWVDVAEATRLAEAGEAGPLERVGELWAGDLLEGVEVRDPEFESWLQVERVHLRARLCRALEAELRRVLAADDAGRTRVAAEALLKLDPAHEDAHRTLIRLHAARGDSAAALRQFEACRQALRRELELSPSAETEELIRQVRAGSSARASVQPRNDAHVLPAAAGVARPPPYASVCVTRRQTQIGGELDEAVGSAVELSVRMGLSRVRGLEVVEEAAAPPAEPGEARSYKVTLTFMRAGRRLRVGVELHNLGTGRLLWADHAETPLGRDLFGVVDALAASLSARLDREIQAAEIQRASRRPIEALSAYDCVLRAIPSVARGVVLLARERRLGGRQGCHQGRDALAHAAGPGTGPTQPARAGRRRAYRGVRGP
jgi:DNA-binding SARP family transcriptional activator